MMAKKKQKSVMQTFYDPYPYWVGNGHTIKKAHKGSHELQMAVTDFGIYLGHNVSRFGMATFKDKKKR